MSYFALKNQIIRFCKENPTWHYKSVFEKRVWRKKNGAAFIADTVTRTLRGIVEDKIIEMDLDEHGYARYRIRGGEDSLKPRFRWETVIVDGVPLARKVPIV